MGTITRSFANNLTTNGILKAGAFNNASLNNVTALNVAIATGNMVLISSQTANNSASISFTTGINSTFKEYQFYFIDIHPRTDNVIFQFQGSTNSGSNYNVTITSSTFRAFHQESGANSGLTYIGDDDLAQSTNYQFINSELGNGADESMAGSMSIFNPASTSFVKHFISTVNRLQANEFQDNHFIAGYFNTTTAINAFDFKMSSGNFDGDILMYGIK